MISVNPYFVEKIYFAFEFLFRKTVTAQHRLKLKLFHQITSLCIIEF